MSFSSGRLTIGPVRFVLHGADSHSLRYEDWAYRGFFTGGLPQDVSMAAAVNLPVRIVHGGRSSPDDSPLFQAGSNWAVWPDGDGLLFCTGYGNRQPPSRACHIPHNLDHAVLHIKEDPADRPLRYPLDQILTWGLLGTCGGLLLHAAGVVRDGVGYVLAGRSGAGKSTLAALCHQNGWEILNDDRVIVYPDEVGIWQVVGTPWHGSGRFARNRTVPLRGVCMLRQSAVDAIEPVSAREARLGLLDVASIAWFEPEWSQHALDALARLTQDVAVHRFDFTRTAKAVAVLERRVTACSESSLDLSGPECFSRVLGRRILP